MRNVQPKLNLSETVFSVKILTHNLVLCVKMDTLLIVAVCAKNAIRTALNVCQLIFAQAVLLDGLCLKEKMRVSVWLVSILVKLVRTLQPIVFSVLVIL